MDSSSGQDTPHVKSLHAGKKTCIHDHDHGSKIDVSWNLSFEITFKLETRVATPPPKATSKESLAESTEAVPEADGIYKLS